MTSTVGRASGSLPAQPAAASVTAAATEAARNDRHIAFAATPAPGCSERSVPLIRSAMLIRDSAIHSLLIERVDRIPCSDGRSRPGHCRDGDKLSVWQPSTRKSGSRSSTRR
ncbi:hypothetical protein Acsp04_05120 [Actinomadura sp. NBRC 104425]|nr:hypothetical protein Acsp04_05120 [Actinomadura sp. NBRC 104425]